MKPLPIDDLQGLRSLGSALLKGYQQFDGEPGAKEGTARAKVEVATEEALAAEAAEGQPFEELAALSASPAQQIPPKSQSPSGERSFNLWRAFDSRLNSLDSDAQPVSHRRPLLELTTAIFPVAGGVGATTIAATLASMLSQEGQRMLVVDADADPMLSIYLGETPAYGAGTLSADGLGRRGTVHVLAREEEDADSTWLQREWQRMEGRFDQALIDVWLGVSNETFAHAAHAGRILLVMTPDLSSILRLPRVLSRIRKCAAQGEPQTPYLLLNKFDASLELHREVRQRLGDRFGNQLLSFEIRRSDEPAEAFAAGTTVIEFAAQSGVAMDLMSLAHWISVPTAGRVIDAETGLAR